MTTTRPTYTVVLTEYPDGDWSIEPIGLRGLHGYNPLRYGTGGCFLRSRDVADLLCLDAREMIATALDQDRYAFDLRFVSPSGELRATSTITWGRPPDGGPPLTHELVKMTEAMRERVDELRHNSQPHG